MMTCIVGVEKNGRVYLGADGCASNRHNNERIMEPKVFELGDFVIGYTSSFRFGQLLQYRFKPPKQGDCGDHEYLCTDFVDEVRRVLKEHGYATVDNNVERGGTCLIGYRGRLYYLQDDYQIRRAHFGMGAVGSGAETAMGAMYACCHKGWHAQLETALEAASEFISTVGGPFHFVQSKKWSND